MRNLKIIGALAFVLLTIACKKDRDAEQTDALAGHWHVSSFVPESTSEISTTAKEVIVQLIEKKCFPLEYSFTTSGKVSHIDKMRYLDVVNGDNGVEVECYFENVFKDGTFSIRDNVLTLEFGNQTDVLNTVVTDDTFTILKTNFVFMNETVTGKLIFSREEF